MSFQHLCLFAVKVLVYVRANNNALIQIICLLCDLLLMNNEIKPNMLYSLVQFMCSVADLMFYSFWLKYKMREYGMSKNEIIIAYSVVFIGTSYVRARCLVNALPSRRTNDARSTVQMTNDNQYEQYTDNEH